MNAQVVPTGGRRPRTFPISVKRVYDQPTPEDGARVLVDRLWPRGLSKHEAHIDEWCKPIAPSTELRRWYDHQAQRLAEFRRRYALELETPDQSQVLTHLRQLTEAGPLTLLTATKDLNRSHALILADVLREQHKPNPDAVE